APQQRQLLEVAWEALEDGGHVPAKLRGADVGVFIGAFSLDYHALQFGDPFQRSVSTYTAAGSMATMLSNRISYIYDFRGPSMTIDTACSSSLVSLHLACESLRSGESSMALAGGVVLTFAPQYTVVESAGGFLSPEGRCKTFDASASGYVRGEGVGVVALKRLTDAMEAGDPIQAVILASSVNQDGHTVGITVPSGDAQAQLIRDTLRKAGVKPTDIRYVEAHGTGTPVGDPIEAGAIGEVYGEGRPASEPLLVGSCKTNIGHTESAAGIAGFMKAVLCLRHRQIPPHLHLQQPNPAIAFDRLRLKLPTAMETWPEHEGPAIAAVNSFGFGGANAHAIVREPLPHERTTTGSAGTWAAEVQLGVSPAEAGLEAAGADLSRERVYVLPLSTRKAEALEQARAAYRQRLTESGGLQPLALEDLCWSAGVRREHHNYRQALVFRSREELDALLKGSGPAGDATQAGCLFSGRKPSGEKPRLVWTFSGMGPQWYGMGRQLLRQEPVFRETMERGDALFAPIAGWSMLAELCKDEADSRMNEAAISMPISFLLQVSLAALWRSWGMTPDLIVGHSAGEVAAFYEAGVYTLEDALRVVYHRSRLLDRTSGTGGMAFVAVSETEAAELLDGLEDKISIAAVNSPTSVTLSGDTEALAEAVKRAEAKGLFTRILRVQVPFHSRYLEPIKEELIDCLKYVPSRPASVPLYSSVTASEIRGEEIDGAYWWRNVRETVAYASAIDQLIRQGYTNYLEIGAHPVLSGALAECLGDNPGLVVASIRRKEDEPEAMMRGLAELYTAGFEPDWQAIYRQGRWMTLPAYPWQKKRYWHEPEFIRHIRHGHKDHPLLGRPLPGAMKAWESEILLRRLPYLRDHRVLEQVLYPAAAYIEGAMAMLSQALSPGEGSFVLEQLELHRGLMLSANQPSAVMQHVLDVENGTFRIFSAQDEQRSAFVLHASGRVRQLQRRPGEAVVDISAARQATPLVIDQAKAYRILKHAGFEYGPAFQGIQRVHLGDDEAWVEVELPLEEAVTREYGFHPSLLDACFQALLAAEFPAEGEQPRDFGHEFRIPVQIGSICFYARPDGRLWAHSRMIERNNSFTRGNLHVYNDRGMLVAEFLDFVKQSVDAATSRMDELQARRWLNRL
ncbi:type I polyketide synthase, partial [Paenibacillus forsythiae]|uniref:type I polyketide synthase n=1 Tax=Paenibacillus forsythiae TaxID=365616 RepID=UPI00046E615D